MSTLQQRRLLAAIALLVVLAYVPGLSGGWFFDDYPNIVDNTDVQPQHFGMTELVTAAASSPASELRRPLASLSFVANYWLGGMNPIGWKLTNLAIHLLNGWFVYLLCLALFEASASRGKPVPRAQLAAAFVMAGWLLLPVNLTAVLFVVQRMESLANLFVLIGLLGYVRARHDMLYGGPRGFTACVTSIVAATIIGVLAKETAILLPLYAFLVELVLFGFRRKDVGRDRRVMLFFGLVLALPAIIGLGILLPWLLQPTTWEARDFTLAIRLLSEARIVPGYITWTLLPQLGSLSFYHDHFIVSSGWLSPPTTALGLLAIVALLTLAWWLRKRAPLVALGLLLYFGSHLLTGTVLPLELIYEHRNYFSSFSLVLIVVPLLLAPTPVPTWPRHALLALLMLWWMAITAFTAHAWGDPLRLAIDIATRAPDSPRAQFGLGKALLESSKYDPASPQFEHAFMTLKRAASMPESSILPEQTMILTYSLLHRPAEESWWNTLIEKLGALAPNAEDVSALGSLTRCMRDKVCEIPAERMQAAFAAADGHTRRNPRLLSIHSDFAWNVLNDRALGKQLAEAVVEASPRDADARITLVRINLALGDTGKAREQLAPLERLNWAGNLDNSIAELHRLIVVVESRTQLDRQK